LPIFLYMKCEVISSEEDKRKKIFRIQVTPENWEENEQIAKAMGVKLLAEHVELNFELKRRINNEEY